MANFARIVLGICSLLLSVYTIFYYMAGNHGHLMFRPHMTEDWIIWGIAVLSAACGIYLLLIKKSSR
jgi:hypothetical protein